MKLGPEAGQPAAPLASNSDKNLSFYLLQNTRLVALAFFQSRQLETQGLESRPDRRHHAHPSLVESKS